MHWLVVFGLPYKGRNNMGYCIDVEIHDLVIPADKVDDCLAAINGMFTDEKLLSNAGGGAGGPNITAATPVKEKLWYSWVQNPDDDGFDDIQDAFDAWRYDAIVKDDDTVVIQYFTGEKLGDDEQLFNVIAPFVKSGAEIYMHGEDGENWRYVFANGEVKEEHGTIVYE